MGHPISLLKGHTGPVSYVDFSRALPDALVSSSFDGTCRIWNVRDPTGQAMHVLHASTPIDLSALPRPSRLARSTPAGLGGSSLTQHNTRGGAQGVVAPAGPVVLATGMQLRHPNPPPLAGAQGLGGAPARAADAEAGMERTASNGSVSQVGPGQRTSWLIVSVSKYASVPHTGSCKPVWELKVSGGAMG